jgi:hypothetical protein
MINITTKSGKKIATLSSEQLRITKSVEALSDLNNIQKEAALRVSLPFDALFLDESEVEVVVRTGTFVLPYTKLVTTSWDAAAQLFEKELVSSHWIEGFDTLFLADLALGTFDFTVANVMATWSLPGAITFPIVDYGNFVNPAHPSIEDLRPFLQVKAIVEKAFCKVGYTFSCPYLDTDAGKMQYGYYLKKDFWAHNGHGKGVTAKGFQLSNNSTLQTAASIGWESKTDFGNHLDLSSGKYLYSGAALVAVDLVTQIEFIADTSDATVDLPYLEKRYYILVELMRKRGTNTETLNGAYLALPAQAALYTTTIEVKATASAQTNDEFFVAVKTYAVIETFSQDYTSNVVTEQTELYARTNNSFFDIKPYIKHLIEGDTLPIAEMVDEIKVLDILKAVVFDINGRFVTDSVSRSVTLLPANDTYFYGVLLNGFYQDAIIDVTHLVKVRSLRHTTNIIEYERYLEVDYKKSSDKFIKDRVPFLYKKDRVKGISKTKKLENPLYEPTLNGQSIGLNMPQMWDNTDLKTSYDIRPRILTFYGLVDVGAWNFGSSAQTMFPFAAQQVDISIGKSTKSLIYVGANGLYETFYKGDMLGDDTYECLMAMTDETFFDFDFRAKYAIFDEMERHLYRAIAVKDKEMGTNSLVPITFKRILC